MTTNRKFTWKVNSHCFKLHRSYSISFHLSNVGEIFWIESDRTVSEFRKRKRNFLCCVHLLRKVGACHSRATTAKKYAKKRDARAKLLFYYYKFIAFLPFSLPSTSLLAKLPFVVIQKFCYHGNVTSHFSSLLDAGQACCLIYKQTEELGRERGVLGSEHWKTYTLPDWTTFFAGGLYWISRSSDAWVLAYQGRRQFDLVKVIKKLQLGDGVCAHLGLHLTKDKESILLHLWSYLFQYFLYYIMHRIVEIKWNMVWIENYCAMRMDTEVSLISSPHWFIRVGFRFKHVHAF